VAATDRITAHVQVLASDEYEGRAPGSAGETKTVEYITRAFAAAGLQPGGETDASGSRRWTQDVPLAVSQITGDLTARIDTGISAIALRQGEEMAVRASHLPGTRVSIAAAPLVFIGYGVSAPEVRWDDFKGMNLGGSVGVVLINDPDFEADRQGRFGGRAMTYCGRWTYKFEEAARRGLAGVLVVNETSLALTAEEKGLLGSEYYAQHPLFPTETTVAVLNIDGGSIGGVSRDVAIGDGKLTLQRDLASVAQSQGRRFSPDPQPQAGSFFRSDHFPLAKMGVPAISFRTGLDLAQGGVAAGQAAYDDYIAARYHQPADEWTAAWDLRGFVLDLDLLYTLGRELAASRVWPEWLEGSEFKAFRDRTAASRL
jgi:Zn-dependent M28 family amino/carboxypeptidase